MNAVTLARNFIAFSLLPAGFAFGWYMDRRDTEKHSIFRHKSKLFQGEIPTNQQKA